MAMPIADNARRVTKAAGAATVAAPYLRRVMSDEQVRDDLRTIATAAGRLFGELSSDDRIRKLVTEDSLRQDVDEILEAMQDAGRRVIQPRRRVDWGRILFWGGLAGAVAAVFAVPQSRTAVVHQYRRLRGEPSSPAEESAAEAQSAMSEAA
jgi:hypothetical protein